MRDKLLAVSIMCLSVSLIIAAVIMGYSIKTAPGNANPSGINADLQQQKESSQKAYNLKTAAEYLGIKEFQLKNLVDDEHNDLPYTKIGDTYIFSKSALDKWLESGPRKIN